MVGGVLSQLKHTGSAVKKASDSATAFSAAKNVELRGFYPIHKPTNTS